MQYVQVAMTGALAKRVDVMCFHCRNESSLVQFSLPLLLASPPLRQTRTHMAMGEGHSQGRGAMGVYMYMHILNFVYIVDSDAVPVSFTKKHVPYMVIFISIHHFGYVGSMFPISCTVFYKSVGFTKVYRKHYNIIIISYT